FGDVSHLAGQVAGHRVHRVRQVFPSSGHTGDVRLTSEPTFATDFTRHARNFGGERTQLLDHGVQLFFELEDFSSDVHRDLAREVAACDGRRDFGDVSHLASQVAGHEVHVVRQVLPRAAHAGYLGLAAQFPFGADLARHAGNFSSECVQLVHHRVDGFFEEQNFTADVHRDFL